MEQPYVYTDLNDVPELWKKYKGAKLSLFQVNSIIEDAYKNAITKNGIAIPDYGGAKSRFEEQHLLTGNLWMSSTSVGKSAGVEIK